ncbi:glutamate 5-kinase [uncultured Eubacterium sp.]|uniref:glutamate 5-kinase n=1 Tax=uncultured Eubacterium sp. TaxID=165185 RepID=UPI0025F38000|nr:glutamate 5-kinase [uncultured Eubacterium sp.]
MEKKRIVVKVGTSTLTHKTGKTNIARISNLVNVLADLHNMGHEIILVSSGAIAIGTSRLGLKRKPDTIMGKQAAAAVGQGELMFLYDKFFGEYDVVVSQLLFTYDALENSDNKEHLTNTFNQLLEYGSIPVVNENDSVSIEELLNGDNDCLSATVAELIGADMLILLTDTDGLYDGNPSENPEARLIDIVEEITEEIEAFAGGAGKRGTGGFMTKVKAAKIATSAGIPVVVMNGADPKKIYDVLNGENVGTKFLS